MKKINTIIISLVFLLSGCTEFLILEPQDELIREEYWKTSTDVIAVLGTSYASMSELFDEIYPWSELRGGLLSPDEKRAKQETLEFYNFNVNAFNEKTQWGDFYYIINLANTIIEYAPLAKENDLTYTDIAYNGHIAEAYFIRSLCYFYLVKSFKDVPFITKSYSKDDQDFNFPKSDEKEIIGHLIDDLNGVVDHAFSSDYFNTLEEQKGRVTKNAIYALLADLYLWNDEYQNCIDAAKQISGIYLVNGEDYFTIFAGNGNSLESIFELQFNRLEYQTTNNLYALTSNNSEGEKQSFVSEYLISLYNLDDKRQFTQDGSSVTYNPNSLSIWKYEGQAPYNPTDRNTVHRTRSRSDANWIFYRLSDVILMQAEAYAELGDFDNAITQLNIIKDRAGIKLYSAGNEKLPLLTEILDERAREFVGEGKRWFDMVRVCRRDTDNRLLIMSDAVMSNVDPRSRSAVANKLKDINSWFLPIFNGELQLNKELKQNTFYE